MAIDMTASGVLGRLRNEIPQQYNTDVGSVMYDILAAAAIEFEAAYDTVSAQTGKNLISAASGDDLDNLLSQMGYSRKAATYAEGYVTITGTDGAEVTLGMYVASGKTLYEVTESGTISNGSATIPIRAKMPGKSGNAPAGAVNYFPVMPENLLTVSNTAAITGGTDSETDDEFRERYYYFLDHPVTSGNIYEYEQWAREIDGVGLAKCYGTWNGPGTVKVVIATADMEPASDDLVDAVAAHIEEQRLIGPTVTVVSATSVEINVTATIFTDGAYSVDAAKAAFMTELTAYLKTIGFSGGVVPYTRIGAIIQSLPGVNYYTGYTLNGGTANVEINDGELAVVGTVTITGGVQS